MANLTNEMPCELQGYDHWRNFKVSIVGALASQGFCVSLIVAGWWFQALATRSIQSDGLAYLVLVGEFGASSLLMVSLARFTKNARALGLSRMRVLLWLGTEALLQYLLVYLLTARSLFTV